MSKKVVQSSYYDMMVTNLVCDLEIKIDEATRCQEILNRLQLYKPEETLPIEVVDFIGNYANIQIVSQEASIVRTVSSLVKNALEAIIKAITWIIAKLRELFKYCFDKEYRTCKDMLDLQRRFITLSVDMSLKNKFENATCDVVANTYVTDVINSMSSLINLIENSAGLRDVGYIDTLMTQFAPSCHVTYSSDGILMDTVPDPVIKRSTTYSAAGWSFTKITECIVQFIAVLKGIEKLKDLNKKIESAVSDLKTRAENAALNGASTNDVNQLQRETAAKMAMTKLIGYSIAILVRRADNISAFVQSLYDEVGNVKRA